MDDNESQSPTILTILADYRRPIIGGLLGWGVLFAIHPGLPFVSLGPLLIWFVVRALNRRDAPRLVKPPAD